MRTPGTHCLIVCCTFDKRERPSARRPPLKNFPDAAFSPEVIENMTLALEQAIAALPEPVSSGHVAALAESILRTAKSGVRDVAVLQRIALVELQITPR